MPELHHRSYRIGNHRGKYVVKYTDDSGQPVRRSLGTDDRGTAEARAREYWKALTRPTSDRLADLWPAYVADRKAAGVDPKRFESSWRALAPHFAHRLGRAINRDDCRGYHRARKALGRADSSIKTELEFLRACLNFHYKKEAPAIWLPPASAPRDRYLTKAEFAALLDVAETPHIRVFLVLALTTGARMGALMELTWDRVDFARGTIDLRPPGRHQTNKRRTIVPMNDRARAALEEAAGFAETDNVIEYNGQPVKSVKKAVAALARRSGIPCSPHVFRHTAGVWMAEADVPMQKISQYLGHTSTKVTESTYARYSPSFMRDASHALNW